jgi:hypothetical protein
VREVIGPHRLDVPHKLLVTARRAKRTNTLHQVGDDIWTCYAPIAEHTDSTADGLLTYGFIIANDAEVILRYDGKEYAIRPGTMYRIDGHKEHSTRGEFGLFAALIWDMPSTEYDFDIFESELMADPRFK